ncbi:MAG: hypothetical protein KF819_20200 [Labilithrix sp.]|nr:hypothetical protein [Labilithrix sp.]
MRALFGPVAFVLAVANVACTAPATTSSQETEQIAAEAEPRAPGARVPGSGEIVGTVGGEAVVVADAVAVFGVMSDRDEARRGVRIALRDRAAACDAPNVVHPGERTLTLEIDGDRELRPGTYGLPEPFATAPAMTINARLDRLGPACETRGVVALGGKVTLVAVDASRVEGTFDLKLGHDRVTGSFVATSCARAEQAEQGARAKQTATAGGELRCER